MNKKNKELNRIKKCLELAKSSNQFEAQNALNKATALMKKYEININDVNCNYMNDENVHDDICKERSTFELYLMWQNSAAMRAYMLEKLILHRTGKWIDELEETVFKNYKNSNRKINMSGEIK